METLIDKLLVEQSNLQTPVAQFSKIHNNHEIRTDLYKHLIPLEKPARGEQYTFQVELDKCTGCKACLVACHTLNGLDEDEAWRDVGLLEGGDDADERSLLLRRLFASVDGRHPRGYSAV